MKECTFTPKTNISRVRTDDSIYTTTSTNVVERLYPQSFI